MWLAVGSGLRRWGGVLLILALPWFYLSINDNWFFSPPGSDPWRYLGCFHDYRFLQALCPGTYPGSRLPWIVPGYIAYQLFPPMLAHYVFHLLLFYIAALSLYYVLHVASDRRTALLATTVFASYPGFLACVGTDYVDAGVVVYSALSMALATRAALGKQRTFCLLAAGGCYAGIVFLYPFLAVLGLCFWAYLLHADHRFRGLSVFSAWPQRAAFVLSGAALATLACAVFSWYHDSEFWFFMPTVRRLSARHDSTPFLRPITFLYQADFLVPVLLVVVSTPLYLLRRPKDASASAPILVASAAGAVLWYTILECSGFRFFHYAFHVNFLMTILFLGLGAYFLRVPADSSRAVLGAALLLVLACNGLMMAPWNWRGALFGGPAGLGLGLVLCLLGVCLREWGRPSLATVACPVVLGLAYASVTPALPLFAYDTARDGPIRGALEGKARLTRMEAALRELRDQASGRHPYFWYAGDSAGGPEFVSLMAAHGGFNSLFSDAFPSLLGSRDPARLDYGKLVVILSDQPDAFERADEALLGSGYFLRALSYQDITCGNVGYTMTICELDINGQPYAFRLDPVTGCAGLVAGEHATRPQEFWSVATPKSTLLPGEEGVAVTTAPRRHKYATISPRITVVESGNYLFVLKHRLRAGRFIFGALSEDQWLGACESRICGEHALSSFMLPLRAGQQLHLLTSNNDTRPSRYLLEGLKVLRVQGPQ